MKELEILHQFKGVEVLERIIYIMKNGNFSGDPKGPIEASAKIIGRLNEFEMACFTLAGQSKREQEELGKKIPDDFLSFLELSKKERREIINKIAELDANIQISLTLAQISVRRRLSLSRIGPICIGKGFYIIERPDSEKKECNCLGCQLKKAVISSMLDFDPAGQSMH